MSANFQTGEKIAQLSRFIDAGYGDDMDEELALRRRIGKIGNEFGEVLEKLEGYTGENFRKGKFATLDEVMDELLDVANAALGAWEHCRGNTGASVIALDEKIGGILRRAGITEGVSS